MINTTNFHLECPIESLSHFEAFTYQSDFIYKNEYHDCYMLYYIQSGGLEFSFSSKYRKHILLSAGQLFIQPPESDYSYKASSDAGAKVFCLGFASKAEALSLISSIIITPTKDQFILFSLLQSEIRDCFESDVDADGNVYVTKTLLQPFGGEQLVKNYLEALCIQLVRARSVEKLRSHLSAAQTDQLLFQEITNYYAQNITSYQSVPDICERFGVGEAHLQRIFRDMTGMTAIEYFCTMRIKAAKKMMREEGTGFHETAKRMGYHTSHYFSKQFKQVEGIAPTHYLKRLQKTDKDPIKKGKLS